MDEKFSALMDGELNASEAARMLAGCQGNLRAKDAWDTYHLIGDAMRGETRIADMRATIAQRLSKEPTVLAPRRSRASFVARHTMALAASVAAVGFVGFAAWQLSRTTAPLNAPVQIAKADAPQAQPVADTQRIRPAQVPSSYLLAHQEFSPSYAVESAPMLARTVSLQREDSSR